MDIYFGDRRSGRTTAMIDWLLQGEPDEKRVLVVFGRTEAARVLKLIKEKCDSIENWQVITLDQQEKLRGKNYYEVGIDNLELLLPRFIAPISRITATRFADPSPHNPNYIQHGFKVHI